MLLGLIGLGYDDLQKQQDSLDKITNTLNGEHDLINADNLFVAKIEGVADRASAERLTNVELYLSRAGLPDPAED